MSEASENRRTPVVVRLHDVIGADANASAFFAGWIIARELSRRHEEAALYRLHQALEVPARQARRR